MGEFVDLASNPANVTAPGPQAAGLKKVGQRHLDPVSLGTFQDNTVRHVKEQRRAPTPVALPIPWRFVRPGDEGWPPPKGGRESSGDLTTIGCFTKCPAQAGTPGTQGRAI